MKYGDGFPVSKDCGSLPVRGAWIEMVSVLPVMESPVVAPRAGSVD